MLRKIRHRFRRSIQKFTIDVCKSVIYGRKEPKVKNESQVISICRRMIRIKQTELTISIISNKRIIKNNEMGISVVIKDDIINIQSDVFPYKDKISKRGLDFIISLFDNEIEKRINEDDKKNQDLSNAYITNSLNKILNKIQNEQI